MAYVPKGAWFVFMKKAIITALTAICVMQTAVYAENKLNAVYNAETDNIVLSLSLIHI